MKRLTRNEKIASVGFYVKYGPVLPVSYAIALLGLTSTYWSDKYIALRRCQKPVRLRNKSTVAVVTTVNVLAVVQVIVSGVVFYNGNKPAFFVLGLVMWLCFNVLPVKRLCGIKRDEALEEGGTGNVSYHANIGWKGDEGEQEEEEEATSPHLPQLHTLSQVEGSGGGAGGCSLSDADKERARVIHCKLLRIRPEEYDRGRLEMYYPPIPAVASDQTVASIVDEYRLFEKAVPGDPTLLPGQKSATGGAAHVHPPDRRVHGLGFRMAPGRGARWTCRAFRVSLFMFVLFFVSFLLSTPSSEKNLPQPIACKASSPARQQF